MIRPTYFFAHGKKGLLSPFNRQPATAALPRLSGGQPPGYRRPSSSSTLYFGDRYLFPGPMFFYPRMFTSAFYDKLAAFSYRIYPNWQASIERRGEASDTIIGAEGGPHLRTVLNAACGIGSQSINRRYDLWKAEGQ
jgi:hypothetical protein